MARLVGLMAVTVWLSAATVDGRNGATAEITQLQDLRQNAGALLFEAGEGIGQKAPPIRTYLYVRIIDSKKETRQLLPCRSRTRRPVPPRQGWFNLLSSLVGNGTICLPVVSR